jgi:hypothetical protein
MLYALRNFDSSISKNKKMFTGQALTFYNENSTGLRKFKTALLVRVHPIYTCTTIPVESVIIARFDTCLALACLVVLRCC